VLGITANQLFHPGQQPLTAEQEQLTQDMFSRDAKGQRIVSGTVRALLQELDKDSD
jgi:hypothetical protein